MTRVILVVAADVARTWFIIRKVIVNRIVQVVEPGMKVTITAPTLDGVGVQDLVQRAWRSMNKEITIGQATVKVRGFGR